MVQIILRHLLENSVVQHHRVASCQLVTCSILNSSQISQVQRKVSLPIIPQDQLVSVSYHFLCLLRRRLWSRMSWGEGRSHSQSLDCGVQACNISDGRLSAIAIAVFNCLISETTINVKFAT